jgi:hypothetical protein
MNLQKPKPSRLEKPKKRKQTHNDHFELLKQASLIPTNYIINDEYIWDQRNNKNKNKIKKCYLF